jgi:lysophospholipase L1-like esterase
MRPHVRPGVSGRSRVLAQVVGVLALVSLAAGVLGLHGLLAQGRAATVEAAPRAQGIRLMSGPQRIVVLGDSVAAGSGCDCTPFATLLARHVADRVGRKVAVTNEGRDGLTTAQLRDELDEPPVRSALTKATLVTVTIGANDFDPDLAGSADCLAPAKPDCYRARLDALSNSSRAVLARVRGLVPSGTPVLVTGYWNVFLDGVVGRQHGSEYVAVSDALTRAVNGVLQQQAIATGGQYVDLYGPFESRSLSGLTSLLAADGDHPSAAGHELIARTLDRAAAGLGAS